jgi:hypothetical protein
MAIITVHSRINDIKLRLFNIEKSILQNDKKRIDKHIEAIENKNINGLDKIPLLNSISNILMNKYYAKNNIINENIENICENLNALEHFYKNNTKETYLSSYHDSHETYSAAIQSDNIINDIKEKYLSLLKDYETKTNINEELNSRLNKIILKNRELSNEIEKANSEKTQKRIDENITEYVKDVSSKLDSDSKKFELYSLWLIIIGGALCITAVVIAIYLYCSDKGLIFQKNDITFTLFIYSLLKGSIGVALLLFAAITCFSNSRKYAHESIRRKDMQHAMMFGRLFMQIYGDSATKVEARDVFKDWNISGTTAFSKENNTKQNQADSSSFLENESINSIITRISETVSKNINKIASK